MSEQRSHTPEEIAHRTFGTAFRGFDQVEVRSYLAEIGAALTSAREREDSLRDQLAVAEAKVAEAGGADLDAALGQEAAKVLQAARQAAAEIRGRAEEQVGRLVREATDDANRIRSEAESILAERTAQAEAAAESLRAESAREAAAIIEKAKARGREMVREAQTVRERVLKDLARRRKQGQRQIEELRAVRGRLLEAYELVRRTLDEATGELEVADAEASAAGEAAARLAAGADEAGDPEAEIAAAFEAGIVVDLAAAEDEPAPGAAASLEARGASAPAASGVRGRARKAKAVGPARSAKAGPAAAKAGPAGAKGPVSAVPVRRGAATGGQGAAAGPGPDDEVEGVRLLSPEESARAARRPAGHDANGDEPGAVASGDEQDEHNAGAGAGEAAADEVFARLRADRDPEPSPAGEGSSSAPVEDDGARVAGEPGDRSSDSAAATQADEPGASPPASDDEVALERRDLALEPVERSIAKALKRALSDEQNEVLDALRRSGGAASLELLLPPDDEHVARLRDVALGPLREACRVGAGAAVGDGAADAEGRGAEEPVGPDVSDLADRLAHQVAGDLRDRVRRALDTVVGDDEALMEAISAAYRQWKASRVGSLARHHVIDAHSRGWFESVPDGPLRWVFDRGGDCGPDCDDNVLAGATPKGEPFPTGHLHPPAHPACRCMVVVAGAD